MIQFLEEDKMIEQYLSRKSYLQSLMAKVFQKKMKDSHLTRESGILLYLVKNVDLSQKEMAEHLHITEASLSGRLKRLERDGYLKKVEDPHDRRKHKIVLNKSAEEEADRAIVMINEIHEQMVKGLTREDYDHINNVLDICEKNLNHLLNEE